MANESMLDRVDEETREGLTFMADILSASMAQTHAASDRVLAWAEESRDMYAEQFVLLWEAVNDAAETATSRRLERVLEAFAGRVEIAQDHLERTQNHV